MDRLRTSAHGAALDLSGHQQVESVGRPACLRDLRRGHGTGSPAMAVPGRQQRAAGRRSESVRRRRYTGVPARHCRDSELQEAVVLPGGHSDPRLRQGFRHQDHGRLHLARFPAGHPAVAKARPQWASRKSRSRWSASSSALNSHSRSAPRCWTRCSGSATSA